MITVEEKLTAKAAYQHVAAFAQSTEACLKAIEAVIAQTPTGEQYGPHYWKIVSTMLPHQGFVRNPLMDAVHAVVAMRAGRSWCEDLHEVTPTPENILARQGAFCEALQSAAQAELKLYALMMLVDSDPEQGGNGVVRRISAWCRAGRETAHNKKRWHHFVDLPRVAWKSGMDFRSASEYCFVRLDGQEILHFWPEGGQRQEWI